MSPCYEELALAVCRHPPTLKLLASLPQPKQQPNLLFAATRHLFGDPQGGDHFLALVAANADAVREVMLTRSTQTNEPARCATLLPVLARLPQPLALIEVGASAGLCLLPDHYSYRYGERTVTGLNSEPCFSCDVDDATPVPEAVPEVVWRVGVDLAPVDTSDEASAQWLETLVWPEHEQRRRGLRAALEVAGRHPVDVRRRDLREPLDDLVAEAPAGATVVVMHSAALAYLGDQAEIDRFVAHVGRLPVTWVSNEAAPVLPTVAQAVPAARRHALPGSFLLGVDGSPVAFTGPHGQSIRWIGGTHDGPAGSTSTQRVPL